MRLEELLVVVYSRFNILVDYRNGKSILYNTFTSAIALLNSSAVVRYLSNSLTDQEVASFISRGFIVPDEYCELDEINRARIAGIEQESRKVFRIWTTTLCNARCFYCFEQGVPDSSMGLETASQVVTYIEDKLHTSDRLEIEWFGGEPLCNLNAMRYITGKLKMCCKEMGVDYHASIISNGSLITKKLLGN